MGSGCFGSGKGGVFISALWRGWDGIGQEGGPCNTICNLYSICIHSEDDELMKLLSFGPWNLGTVFILTQGK